MPWMVYKHLRNLLGIPIREGELHKHKCICGHVWEHSDNCGGDTNAHTCPNCGAEQWMRYYGDEPVSEPVSEPNPYLFHL